MKNKEHRRIRITKLLLKNSLIELMGSKPINKITIKELCINADVNRSTFYLYYTDQLDLLKEIEDELLSHLKKHLDKMDSDYGTISYLDAMLSYIMENADIFRTLLCHQESPSFQSTFVQFSLTSMTKNLEIDCSDIFLTYVYEFLLMGCLSMIKKWIEADFNLSCREMAGLIFHLSDQAISAFNR